MVEGYSVTDAASVLGVPTERVWELLARGVLTGAPDGESGMRVFLQARPAAPPTIEVERPAAPPPPRNPEPESSPFRELLTEFRNLTERYGQALLALGESRGEVASLRSRVDLLEARIDLRLPMSAPSPVPAEPAAPAAPWGDRQPPIQAISPSGEPAAEERPVPVAASSDEVDAEHPPRRRRGRSHRRATDDFAEALARAEDPSPAELPGAAEAGAAIAALREATAVTVEPDADAVSLPRELPAAEPLSVLEPLPEPEPLPVPQPLPEPLPGPEPIVPAEAEAEAEAQPEPESVPIAPRTAVSEAEPGPSAEAEPIDQAWPAEAAMPEVEAAPWPERTSPPGAEAEAESVAATGRTEGPEEAQAATPWDQDRYTSQIEEPDWMPEEPMPVERPSDPEPAWPREARDEGAPASLGAEPERPTREEGDEPAAEMEIAGVRGSPRTPPDEPVAAQARSSSASSFGGVPRTEAPPAPWPRELGRTATHVGPASRAYRRLRRIFPT